MIYYTLKVILLFVLVKFLITLYLTYLINLSECQFQIKYGSTLLNVAAINLTGVLQGGIVSPVLYNIFVSDQPITPNTSVTDYVDEKIIMYINSDPLIVSTNLQNHLIHMESWFMKCRLKVNQNKSIRTTFTL